MGDWTEAGRGWGARAAEWAYLLSRTLDRPTSCCSTAWVSERECAMSTSHVALDSLPILRPRGTPRSPAWTQLKRWWPLLEREHRPEISRRRHVRAALCRRQLRRRNKLNGIWKGCEGALSEARRVLVPAGRLGLTSWASQPYGPHALLRQDDRVVAT